MGSLIELCEESVLVSSDSGGGAVSAASPHCQLLNAAGFTHSGKSSRVTVTFLQKKLLVRD